jgi:hypothetical protein
VFVQQTSSLENRKTSHPGLGSAVGSYANQKRPAIGIEAFGLEHRPRYTGMADASRDEPEPVGHTCVYEEAKIAG